MTDTPSRDFQVPPRPPTTRPPREIQIGYDLEDTYCAYAEWPVIITRGFPSYEIARRQDMGGWTADRLRELGVDAALVDRFEEALAGLPGMEDFPRAIDESWLAARWHTSKEVEHLLGEARAAVESQKVHYYDYGVMLCRVRLCVRMIRLMPELPTELAETLPDLTATYHKELLRATAALQKLITPENPRSPSDSEQQYLDSKFSSFAEYLATWRTGNAELDADFRQQLDEITEAVGFRKGDQAKQEMTWTLHPEPLVEGERLPLPVPHTAEERDQLESYLEAAKRIAAQGDFERFLDLMRELLHACRAILGPVHPLTLHVQIDFAAGYGAVGSTGKAMLMLLDIADTARHYYSPYHPARYLVIAHVHSFFQPWDPDQAQELYDSSLKWLVETEEADIPPALHSARRTIRSALGMDTEPDLRLGPGGVATLP